MTFFPALKPGDTIGIMAPSSRVDAQKIDASVKELESAGFPILIHPQTFLEHRLPDGTLTSSAGMTADKIKAFEELWDNSKVTAIMAARGGNECGEMLPFLNYEKISATPKALIGFSDVTALLLAINRHAGIVTFHGPMLINMGKLSPNDMSQCLDMLSGKERSIDISGSIALRSGVSQGRLTGGNLSVLCSLMGTPYQPDFTNALLFLEDVGDEISRINRFFLQLKLSNALNQISGLIVGAFSDLSDEGRLKFGRRIEDIVEHHMQGTSFPIIVDAPFGHGDRLVTLPIGARAELNACSSPTLKLL